jgi:carboxyl-terminal processing protease
MSKQTFKAITAASLFITLLSLGLNLFFLVERQKLNADNLEYLSSRQEVLSIIKNYSIREFPEKKDLQTGELKGLVSSLEDPYSIYLPQVQNQEFNDSLNQRYEGVGIRFDYVNEQITVMEVFEGPAKKGGVEVGYMLMSVNDKGVIGQTIEDVAKQIRGPKDSEVKLKFLTPEGQKDFKLKRDKISTELITLEFKDDVAILKIVSFGNDLDTKLAEKTKEIREKQAKAVIIDVRGNGGGLLDQTIEVASYFINPNEEVVIEKEKKKEITLRTSEKNPNLWDLPVAVMVDGNSASASEILAGALRDQREAKLIGRKTFGKGTVQQIYNLSNKDNLKLTIAEWYTPKGSQIDKIGLEPDVKVEKAENDLAEAMKVVGS